ncbi:hypothetical protein [Chitinophaga sp. sic0106]|uniref:hypothetical protein n=1 Tax=Chitinophaga sp. sic0106 TaxID=2854785 RepID=UPI001C4427FC|nr:hypothetical protein [Chitinophaga sp. sic0106]MBV7534054.1 hypothetical protein [Chitinophaga sp. sic0106]
MIRSTVIVEGYPLDLTEEVDTDFTYSIQDIREPDKRTTDFSKTISIPGTPVNNTLFAHIFDLNIENTWNPAAVNIGYNFNPNKVAKALILVDGIQIFKGVIRIMNITNERGAITYETNVLGRLSDILFAMGDKKLSDLDFSDLDVSPITGTGSNTLTPANIRYVWDHPTQYRYTYPLIDYGLSTDGMHYPIQGFAPAIYAKEYIDRMFAQNGFTYQCDFFNLPYFKSLVVPSTEKDGFTSSSPKILRCSSRQRSDQNNRVGKWREIGNWWYLNTGNPAYYDKYEFITNTTTDESKGVLIKFTRDLETSIQFSFKYTCSGPGYINVRVNGNVIQNANTGVYALPHTEIIEIAKRQFSQGDEVMLSIDGPPKCKTTFYADTLVTMPSPVDDSAYPVDVGTDIKLNNFVSKTVSQKDFFKSIILMHNLYVFTDPDNETNLFIVPMNQFYSTAASDAVDWTDKIDYSKEVKITPMGELTARDFLFTYKEDSDYYNADKYKKVYNEIYGQRKYSVDNDFQKDTKKIELVFSPTPSVQETGNSRVIPHIYKVDKDGVKSRDAFNIRILQFGGMMPSYKIGSNAYAYWFITDATGATIATYRDYPYCGMFDDPQAPSRDLCFGPPNQIFFNPPGGVYPDVTLFRYYWEQYMLEIGNKDSKLFKAYALLTPADINQLDFKKLVKVDNLYYKLNKVEGYSPLTNDVTKVELFKTIVQVEIVKPGFILHEDGGYLLHDDGSSRIPYA